MAITYGFFDAESFDEQTIAGQTILVPDRAYSPSDMNNYFDGILTSSGVFYNYPTNKTENAFKVIGVSPDNYTDDDRTNHPGMLKATVSDGLGRILGHFVRVVGSESVYFDQGSADGSRVDRVVLRLSTSSRNISLVVLKGNPSTPTKIPEITRNDTTYEIPIARCTVPMNATSTENILIFTPETGTDLCPWITHLVYGKETEANIMTRLDAWLTQYGESIQEWARSLTEDLEVATTIRNFEAIISSGNSWTLSEVLSNYTYNEADVVNVYYNGLRLFDGEYQIEGGVLSLVPNRDITGDNTLHIQVLKSQAGIPTYINGDNIAY